LHILLSIAAKPKIMLVDDHAEMRRLLRNLLSDLASEFTECADGAEAVAAFAHQRPDWTIMDIRMEGMDGLEATRRILRQFAGSRIMMLTQHDTPQMRAAALEAGACAFVSKDNLDQVGTIIQNPSSNSTI
jgi:CheY-like chemotaxis protein